MNKWKKFNRYLDNFEGQPIPLQDYVRGLKYSGFTKDEMVSIINEKAMEDKVKGISAILRAAINTYDKLPQRLKPIGSHTKEEWEEKKSQYGYKCFYCGRSNIALTKDHFLPISKGGSDNITNIVPSCWPCNYKKRAMSIEIFSEGKALKFL